MVSTAAQRVHRQKASQQRAEQARSLIEQALRWKTDDEAAFILADCVVDSRNPRMLAAIYREVGYIGEATEKGQRIRRILKKANDALATNLV